MILLLEILIPSRRAAQPLSRAIVVWIEGASITGVTPPITVRIRLDPVIHRPDRVEHLDTIVGCIADPVAIPVLSVGRAESRESA